MALHNETGKQGEETAVKFLEQKGFVILERNFSYEKAEIDIIARDKNEIVFIEVKTRTGNKFFPEEAVSRTKQKNIFRAAEAFLFEKKLEDMPVRFDVVAVQIVNRKNKIEHFIDAFRKEEDFSEEDSIIQ